MVAPMTQASLSKRRGQGEDSIYWDPSKNRYIGAVSLGFNPTGTRIRKKVTGRTKTEVRDKLRELHKQVEGGLRPRRRYIVEDALEDWLAVGLDGLSARTVTLYRCTKIQFGASSAMPLLTLGRLALMRSCGRPDRRSSPRRGSCSSPPSTTANQIAKPRTDQTDAMRRNHQRAIMKRRNRYSYKSAMTAISSPYVTIERIAVSSNNFRTPNRRDVRIAYSAGRAGAEHPDLGCGCGS
jgi:hypothetical protein